MRFTFLFVILFLFLRGFSVNPEVDSLLQLVKKIPGNDTSKAKYLSEIAYQMAGEDFDSALMYAFQAFEMSENLGYKWGMAKAKNSMGVIYFYNNEFTKSYQNYSQSVKIAEEIGNNALLGKLYSNLGMIDYYQGNYPKALENYFKSLKINQDKKNEKEISTLYNYIGSVYYTQDKFNDALSYYKMNLELTKKLKDQGRVAESYLNIGNCLLEKAKRDGNRDSASVELDSAMAFYDRCLEIGQQIGDKLNMAYAYNNTGEVYAFRKQYEKAIEFYKLGLKCFEEVDELYGIGIASNALGGAYKNLNNNEEAIRFLQRAKNIGREQDIPELEAVAAEYLAEIYYSKGKFKDAYLNYRLYHQMDSTLKSSENTEAITQMAMNYKFEAEKKEREIVYEAEMKRQRLMRFMYLTGLVIAILGGIYVYINFKRKQRDNILLEKQKQEIEEQKKSIMDSIMYARRIQTAILPSPEMATELLKDYFILFRPRDIVSGDFYWMGHRDNKVVVTAADCTGHGVPGAFMSMLGVSFLNEIVHKGQVIHAELILNNLRESVKRTLDQTGKKDEAKDGMDIALCVLDFETRKLEFAGAYNSLYYYRNGEFNEVKADRMPIGIYIKEKESFTLNEVDMLPGDVYYIFSDGYPSQFGGPTGGKLKSSGFKDILTQIHDKPMAEQRDLLDKAIDDWRGELEQVDDVLVIGFRV